MMGVRRKIVMELNIQYLSDYKQGDFGRSTGLLTEGSMLLARSVVIVDKQGVVRYIQVVFEMSSLPDGTVS
jgi:thiol peroxidase